MKVLFLIISGTAASISGILLAGGNDVGAMLMAASIFCYALGTSIKAKKTKS